MSIYTIHVDKTREDGIFQELSKVQLPAGCLLNVSADEFLDDGDIHVYLRSFLIMIIERKRMKDFNNSWKDGRLQNLLNLDVLSQEKRIPQRPQMPQLPQLPHIPRTPRVEDHKIVFADQRFMYPMQVLLVEGKFLRRSKHNLSPEWLKTRLNNLEWQYPALKILRTTHLKDSASKIVELMLDLPSGLLNSLHNFPKCVKDDKEAFFHVTSKASELPKPLPLSKKRKREENKRELQSKIGDIRRIHFRMLRELPGMTIRWAEAFLENNITAMDLCVEVNENQLKLIRGGRRLQFFPRQNLDQLKQICESLDSRREWLKKMFAKIPYIKKPVADTLGDLFLESLQKGEGVDIKKLENHPRVQKEKITVTNIQRALEYWNFRPFDHQPKHVNLVVE